MKEQVAGILTFFCGVACVIFGVFLFIDPTELNMALFYTLTGVPPILVVIWTNLDIKKTQHFIK